jgi:DNA/RNA endonuclease G (NUC1)
LSAKHLDKIEAETGFDFLTEVATSIQAAIESKKDDVEIN